MKPTGDLTLGNYLGAMKRWAVMSKETGTEHFWFVPNLHALTSRPDPHKLKYDTRSAVALADSSGHRSVTVIHFRAVSAACPLRADMDFE